MGTTTKRHYDREFKVKAVELVLQRGKKMQQVADDLGMPFANLRRWKREYEAGHFNEGFVSPRPSAESLEVSRLKRELLDAQLERDILKKAVAIFSKNGR
jgi:transposase